MKEKIKQYFSNSQNIIHCCLILLLMISICLQVKILCSLKKPKSPYGIQFMNNHRDNSNIKKMRKIRQLERERQRAMFKNFDRELENMMRNREKMFMDMDNIFRDDYFFSNEDEWYNSDIQYSHSNGNKPLEVKRKFVFRPRFRELENAYTISVKVPDVITKDDIKVDLQDKNLSINITKEESQNSENSSSYYFDSFSRVYYLKDVSKKSNSGDLKINFDKGELSIEVKKEKQDNKNNDKQDNKKQNNKKDNKVKK